MTTAHGLDRVTTHRSRWSAMTPLMYAAAAGAGAVVGSTLWGLATGELTQLLVLLPTVYLVAAASGRPTRAWSALLMLTAAFFLAPSLAIEPGIAVAGLGFVLTCLNLPSGCDRRQIAIQTAGAAVFVALAVVVFLSQHWTAVVVLAAAWAGHAAWDVWHLRTRSVVPRSYAIWCAALDLVVAAGILLTAFA